MKYLNQNKAASLVLLEIYQVFVTSEEIVAMATRFDRPSLSEVFPSGICSVTSSICVLYRGSVLSLRSILLNATKRSLMPSLQPVVHACDLVALVIELYCLPWRVAQAGALLLGKLKRKNPEVSCNSSAHVITFQFLPIFACKLSYYCL